MPTTADISDSALMSVLGRGLVVYCLVSIALLWAYARTRLYPLYLLKILWVGFTFVGFFWLISMSCADPGPKHGGVASEFMKNPAGPFAALGRYVPLCRSIYGASPLWMFALFVLGLLWRGLVGHPRAEEDRTGRTVYPPVLRAWAFGSALAAGAVLALMCPLRASLRWPGAALLVGLGVSALLVPRRGGWKLLLPAAVGLVGATMALDGAARGVWWVRFLTLGCLVSGAMALASPRRLRAVFMPATVAVAAATVFLVDNAARPGPWLQAWEDVDYLGTLYVLAGCGLWALLPLGWTRRFAAPALLALGVLAAVPAGIALRDFHWGSYTYAVQNYVFAWKTARMGKYMLNSVMVSLLTVGVTSLCASLAAYALARFEFVGRTAVLFGFIGAMVIPAQLYIVPLFLIIQNWHFAVGPVDFSFMDSRLGLSLIYAAGGLPFAIFLLTGFYRTLPGSLREAAAIDGCGEWRIFTDVYFPLAAPGMATAAIFQFLGVWNEYQFALVFLTNDKLKTLPVGLYNLSVSQQYAANWSALFAGITILCLPTFLIFVILQERIVAGLTVGAVKE